MKNLDGLSDLMRGQEFWYVGNGLSVPAGKNDSEEKRECPKNGSGDLQGGMDEKKKQRRDSRHDAGPFGIALAPAEQVSVL